MTVAERASFALPPDPAKANAVLMRLFGNNPLALAVHRIKSGRCRWPESDPVTEADRFRYCGADTYGTNVYCADHCRLAYTGWAPQSSSRAGAPHGRAA